MGTEPVNEDVNMFRLQVRQREHDERYHGQMYGSGAQHRLNHYTHHFFKYAARLHTVEEDDVLEKTIADTTIIDLAASDVLNIDFEDVLTEVYEEPYQNPVSASGKPPARYLQEELLEYGGHHIARAIDSFDHALMDRSDTDPRPEDQLKTGAAGIMEALLYTADAIELDLEDAVFDRWQEIEQERIL